MKGPIPVPTFEELLRNPGAVSELPAEAIPALRGKLAELDTVLLARLMSSANGRPEQAAPGDRLVSVEEAAAKLGCSKDWLYRHAASMPFTVRQCRSLRFSEQGIEKWIRQHAGR